jgi:uncharacterized membrane protein
VFGHNLLDGAHVNSSLSASFGWSVLHERQFFPIGPFNIIAAYPLIPWIGVMALGYCLGSIYKKDADARKRKRFLMYAGLTSVLLFILIRYSNLYGDSSKWQEQSSPLYTVFSFLSLTKYPPSLLYLLMTIGPGLVFLSLTENVNGGLLQIIKTIGRVPMFFYLVHLYLIHTASLIAAVLSGRSWTDMVGFSTWISFEQKLNGYGFSLGVVYAVWAGLIVILYFLCKRYDFYKSSHKEKWWLSYL